MDRKETQHKVPWPDKDEVARALDDTERATFEDELERKRQGLLPEPEGRRLKRLTLPKSPAKVKKEGVKNTADFIEKWQRNNEGYVLQNEDVREADIVNDTSAEIPLDFIDHLISNARESLKYKNLDILGEIQVVKIKDIFSDAIIMSIKDRAGDIIFMFFSASPPFDLKKTKSHHGVYTFKS